MSLSKRAVEAMAVRDACVVLIYIYKAKSEFYLAEGRYTFWFVFALEIFCCSVW